MGLDREPIPGPKPPEKHGGHQAHHGRGAGLVATDFDALILNPNVVRVVDAVGGKPEKTFFDSPENV